jgi:hypothetical protein
MGGLSDSEREQIVGAHLAGASVIKTATLLDSFGIHEIIGRQRQLKSNRGRQ